MGAALSIHVPSARASWFIDRASELGKVTSMKTAATDVGRKVVDAETVLHNLKAALARYQDGSGDRRFFNPYLGFRVGYANLSGDGAFALGGSLGIELVKSEVFALEVEIRALALAGATNGTHVLLVPALTARVAY